MRFSHTADCHIGGHRDFRLRQLTEQAFDRFVSESIEADVDFTIIAGDLFNTAIPGIDTLKFTVNQLGRLRTNNIPVYAIPGSHDYSPSGKTMLDVLEEAGLLINVCKGIVTEQGKLRLLFTQDKKTGAKLTGVIGKRGMLDRHIYEELDHSIEKEPGTKIFLFHTAISELKPKDLQEMESYPVSFLPKGFDYYAGGHVHIVERYDRPQEGYKNVVYPGPLFPNSFSELEHLQHGGYYLYDNGTITRKELALRPVITLAVDLQNMNAHDANTRLHTIAEQAECKGRIVLLRVAGMLASGSPSDINLRDTILTLEERGAHIVLRNTTQLSSKEFQAIRVESRDAPHEIEERLLREHADQLALEGVDSKALTRELLKLLAREPQDGEKVHEYETRLTKEALDLLDAHRR
jgi:DNA repair exonuclease SbcCD nuclease subunit